MRSRKLTHYYRIQLALFCHGRLSPMAIVEATGLSLLQVLHNVVMLARDGVVTIDAGCRVALTPSEIARRAEQFGWSPVADVRHDRAA